jgi:hypothetical protein
MCCFSLFWFSAKQLEIKAFRSALSPRQCRTPGNIRHFSSSSPSVKVFPSDFKGFFSFAGRGQGGPTPIEASPLELDRSLRMVIVPAGPFGVGVAESISSSLLPTTFFARPA